MGNAKSACGAADKVGSSGKRSLLHCARDPLPSQFAAYFPRRSDTGVTVTPVPPNPHQESEKNRLTGTK